MASTISSPVWSGPVPIRKSSAAATAMPSITPPTSSNAWRRRWPWAAARLMTAAIDANAGRGSSSSRIARYHAATAAIAVWRIRVRWGAINTVCIGGCDRYLSPQQVRRCCVKLARSTADARVMPDPTPRPEFVLPKPKRMTPWVKALLVLTLGSFALFGGCVALITGIGHISLYATADSPRWRRATPPTSTATASLGEPLSLKRTTYTVTAVRTAPSANGISVIVDVELTNRHQAPVTLMTKVPTIVGGNGTAQSTSGDALHDPFLRGQIQPGASTRGSLVYDLSPSSVKGAELQVEDLSSDDKGRIPLGL